MSPGLKLYLDFVVFCFGAVIGSFLNVCVHRMPREQSLVRPPSHCPHCHQPIRWFDNIPLYSYLRLRGRCRHCQSRISVRYFLVELLTGVLFLLIWLKVTVWLGAGPERAPLGLALIYWVLIAGLIAASFIDFEHFIIPNEITLGGILVGLVASFLYPRLMGVEARGLSLLLSLLGMVIGGASLWLVVELGKLVFGRLKLTLPAGTRLILAEGKLQVDEEEWPWEDLFYRASDRIRFQAATLQFGERNFTDATVVVGEEVMTVNGEEYALSQTGPIVATTDLLVLPREAMGFGDVKFLAAIGAFLGWQATLFTVFFSSITGAFVGGALLLTGKKDLQSRIPYGPYIALGALLWIFVGQELVQWYLSLIAWPKG